MDEMKKRLEDIRAARKSARSTDLWRNAPARQNTELEGLFEDAKNAEEAVRIGSELDQINFNEAVGLAEVPPHVIEEARRMFPIDQNLEEDK